jgi:hypothetical protein
MKTPRNPYPMPAGASIANLTLWSDARTLIAASRGIVAEVHAARRRSPIRRLVRLAAGANDDEATPASLGLLVETSHRRCPSCRSEIVEPVGRITATDGVLRVSLRCRICQSYFTFIRTPRTFAACPESPSPPPAA